MKKTVLTLCALAFLTSATGVFALGLPNLDTATYPLRGESELSRMNDDQIIRYSYVDWIVSTTSLTTNIDESQFVFATNLSTGMDQGDHATYADASVWYYYYQVENASGNFATSFSLKVDPNTVATIGYILDVDLDMDLDITHIETDTNIDLTGENEPTSQTVVNFTSASFDPSLPTPNGSFNFAGGMSSNMESTVFFISCFAPPRYEISELLPGAQGPEGFVPIPTNPIPEPLTIGMIVSGICGLIIRKRSTR